MSALNNQVSVIGNVGAAPVARAKTRDGTPIVGFAIAQSVMAMDAVTSKPVQKRAQWFQVSCFARLAEKVLGGVSKGDLVLVTGELRASSYTGKDGEKRSAVEIVAFDVCKVERLRVRRVPVDGWDGLGLPTQEMAPGPTFDEWDEAAIAPTAEEPPVNGQ